MNHTQPHECLGAREWWGQHVQQLLLCIEQASVPAASYFMMHPLPTSHA